MARRIEQAARAGGPLAEQARELVARHQAMIDDRFAAHDALIPAVRAASDTHGELHAGELHCARVDDANTCASRRELRGCLDQQPTSRAAR
jgi:hypothetical protein